MESQCARSDGTVLIVDDDCTVRFLAREALEQAGFKVAEVDDSRQALEVFDRINPEIILLDVMMPGIDGFEVCRQIREHPEGWNIPILIMTGLQDFDSIKKAYDTGATDFVLKPCNMLILSYRVRYMMRASQTLRDLSRNRASLTHAQRIAKLGSWEWDIKNDVLQWTGIYRLSAMDPVGFDRTYHAFLHSLLQQGSDSAGPLLQQALSEDKPLSIDHQVLSSDRSGHYLHTEGKVIGDEAGRAVWMSGTVQDISERKQTEEKIRKLAYYDSLTGLPNRVLFKENVARAISTAEQSGLKVAIMFLDMDRFKEINDTMGHDVGDMLLQDFAERLRQCNCQAERLSGAAGGNLVFARLGGDEFTVIQGEISFVEEAAHVARRIVDTMAGPFDLDGRTASITVSIGISIYPDDATDVVTLLKCADIAMYRAKSQGRNDFCFYSRLLPQDLYEQDLG